MNRKIRPIETRYPPYTGAEKALMLAQALIAVAVLYLVFRFGAETLAGMVYGAILIRPTKDPLRFVARSRQPVSDDDVAKALLAYLSELDPAPEYGAFGVGNPDLIVRPEKPNVFEYPCKLIPYDELPEDVR